jgi:hypothetical protein
MRAQADGPRGLPALPSVPELGLPDMPAIALPADADAILAPLPAPRPQACPKPPCTLQLRPMSVPLWHVLI